MDRTNIPLNLAIEQFIKTYAGTAIGLEVLNMYTNGTSYESICEYTGIDLSEYQN